MCIYSFSHLIKHQRALTHLGQNQLWQGNGDLMNRNADNPQKPHPW